MDREERIAIKVMEELYRKGIPGIYDMADIVEHETGGEVKVKIVKDGSNSEDLFVLVYMEDAYDTVENINSLFYDSKTAERLRADDRVFDIFYYAPVSWSMVRDDIVIGVYRVLGGTDYSLREIINFKKQHKD